MLATIGVDEATARERSLVWVTDTLTSLAQQHARGNAETIRLAFIAGQAAQHGGEAFEAMETTIDNLDTFGAGNTVAQLADEDLAREVARQNPGAVQRVNVSGAPA